MTTKYFYGKGESKIFINGKLVDNKSVEVNYDGEKVKIKHSDNDDVDVSYMKLNKKDVLKILGEKSSDVNLEKRLSKDFLAKGPQKKTKKHKVTKKRKPSKKHRKRKVTKKRKPSKKHRKRKVTKKRKPSKTLMKYLGNQMKSLTKVLKI